MMHDKPARRVSVALRDGVGDLLAALRGLQTRDDGRTHADKRCADLPA